MEKLASATEKPPERNAKTKQKGMQEMIRAGENWWQCRACRAFEAGFYVGVVLGAFMCIGIYAIAKAVA